jgi:hypothetical protein
LVNNLKYCENRLKSRKRLLNSYWNLEIDLTNLNDENENVDNSKEFLQAGKCVCWFFQDESQLYFKRLI